jgi:uncharacterized membrane protein YbhN (UPF0104 family)
VDSLSTEAPRAGRFVAYAVLPFVAALGLLVAVVWTTGPAATLATLARLTGWEAAVLVVLAFVVSAFGALAWRVVLGRYGHDVSAWLLFRLSVVAFSVGWLLPSGFVAGLPVAAYVLHRRGVPFSCALASFLIGRFFELAAYAVILPAVLVGDGATSALVRGVLFVPLVALGVGCLDLTCGWRCARRALGALLPMAPRVLVPAVARAIAFCETVATFFQSPGPRIVAVAGLSLLAIGTSFVRALLTADFLAVGLRVPEVALMFAFTLFLLAVPFLPGAVGVYEGGIAGFFHVLGRPETAGIAYAMTVHAVELVVVLTGFVFLALLGLDLRRLGVPALDGRAGGSLASPDR